MGSSAKNTQAWRISYYDAQKKEWVMFDEVKNNTLNVTTRSVEPVTPKQLWLEILSSSAMGDKTVRLYELEIYRNKVSN